VKWHPKLNVCCIKHQLNSVDGLLLNQDELIEKMKQKLAELGATIDEPLTQDVCLILISKLSPNSQTILGQS